MQAFSLPFRWHDLGRGVLIALVYFIFARLALLFVFAPAKVAALWPPSGIALAALALTPPPARLWTLSALFIANTAANLTAGHALPLSLGFAVANVFECGLLAWLLTRGNNQVPRFVRLTEILRLVAVAVGGNALTALGGAAVAAMGAGALFGEAWLTWYIADGLGILLFTPLVIVWSVPDELGRAITLRRLGEGTTLILLLLVLTVAVFSTDPNSFAGILIRPYLLTLLLIVFALRFSLRGTGIAVLLVNLVGIFQTISGAAGVFTAVSPDPNRQILATQLFLGIVDISILILVGVFAERLRAQRVLQPYQLFVENARDAMLFVRRDDGKIIEANQAALDMYGYTRTELLAKTVYDLRPPEERTAIPTQMTQADHAGILFEATHYRKDGTTFPVEVSSRGTMLGNTRVLMSIVRDITERKRAEAILRASEQKFAAIFERAPILMTLSTLEDGTYLAVNEKFLEVSEFSREEVIGKTSVELGWISAADRARLAQLVREQSRVAELELTLHTKDKRPIICLYNGELLTFDGKPCLLSLAIDITARKATEQALAQSEQLYRSLINIIPEGVALSDAQGNIQFASPQLIAMHGGAPDESVVGLNALQWIDPKDHAKALANIQALFTNNTLATDHEYTLLRRDGSRFIGEIDGVVLRDAHGAPLGIVTVHRDITARKHAEEQLRASQARLQSIFHAAPIGIGVTVHRVIQEVNTTFCEMLQYTSEELVGQSTRMLYPTQADFDYVGTEKYWQISVHGIGTVETRWQRKDGKVLDILLSATPLNPNDLSQGVLFIALDITERKRVETELRISEEKFRKLFDASADPFFLLDAETGEFYDANAAATALYGYTREEIIGKNTTDLSAEPEKSLAVLRTRETFIPLRWHRKKDGTRFPVEIKISYLTWNNREVRLSVVRDITARLEAENALRASEERYRQLFSKMLNGFALHEIICDETGMPYDYRFLEVNPAFEQMTGLRAADIIGKTVRQVIPEIETHWINIYGRVALTGEPVHFENHAHALGKYFEVTAFSTKPNQFVTIFADVTARRQREQELEAIASVSAALRRINTTAEMFPLVLDQTATLLRTDAAAISLYDPNTGASHIEWANGQWSPMRGWQTPPETGISGYIWTTGKPYVTTDLANDPLMYHREMVHDLRDSITVPLISQEQTIGWISVGARRVLSDTDVRVLRAIADIAANAIHRATLYEQTLQHMQRLTALNVIDRTINASLDLRVTLNILLDQVNAQLGIDASALSLFHRQTQTLECRAEHGMRHTMNVGVVTRLGHDATSRAILERRMVSLPDLSNTNESFARSQALAPERFVAYYAVPLIAKGYVKGILEVYHRQPFVATESWLDFFKSLGEQAALAVDNADLFNAMQRSNDELGIAYDATIEGWSRALDLRDKETEGHTLRVMTTTLELARRLGVSDQEIAHIRRGALLHDIGKMGIPDAILLKPDSLTPQEWEIMRLHPVYAYELLTPITYLKPAISIPYCHHEKWDGTGYPNQLRGTQIPLYARIFAIVDVWDALSHDRPYRAAWPPDRVFAYLREQSGKHFDPAIVEVFLRMMEQ